MSPFLSEGGTMGQYTLYPDIKKDRFRLFDLGDFFPGHKLLVNGSTLIVSSVPLDHDTDEYVIAQRILDPC